MKTLLLTLAIVMTFFLAVWGVVRTIEGIRYEQNVGGYLKRSADSNTIALADRNLATALAYLAREGISEKSGYTSVLWRTPDEDVGFWYENLESSLRELRTVSPDSSQLEQSNVLMKLRETLLDEGQLTSVTAPEGISIYPNNTSFFWWAWVTGILACFFWFWILLVALVAIDNDY